MSKLIVIFAQPPHIVIFECETYNSTPNVITKISQERDRFFINLDRTAGFLKPINHVNWSAQNSKSHRGAAAICCGWKFAKSSNINQVQSQHCEQPWLISSSRLEVGQTGARINQA